jgi:hypothetical protein
MGKVMQPESEIVFQQYALKLDDLQSVLAIHWEGTKASISASSFGLTV